MTHVLPVPTGPWHTDLLPHIRSQTHRNTCTFITAVSDRLCWGRNEMRAPTGQCSSGQRGEGCRNEWCYFQRRCIVLLPHVRWHPTELHIFWRCYQKILSVWKHETSRTRLVTTLANTQASQRSLKTKPAGSSCQIGGLSHHMNMHVSSLAGLQRHIVRSQHVWRKVKGALTSLLARSYSRVGKYESRSPGCASLSSLGCTRSGAGQVFCCKRMP